MNHNHLKEISAKGGRARVAKHGNPGTQEGRRRGGMHSLKTHKLKGTKFKLLQNIRKVSHSKKFAELMGILMGDGHASKYQISIVTNSETDKEHAYFCKNLLEETFNVPTSIKKRSKKKALVVVLSSKKAVECINRAGMPLGNKIHAGMRIPQWIQNNIGYSKAFIRGLFDTDGCVYLDHHYTKKQKYSYTGWTITSNAGTFISDVEIIMKRLGFAVTHRSSQNSIFMRRHEEVHRYFDSIGTHNSKHAERYERFNKLKGRVPKRS